MSPRTQDALCVTTFLGMLVFMGVSAKCDMEGGSDLLVGTLRFLTVGCMFIMQWLVSMPTNNTHQAQA